MLSSVVNVRAAVICLLSLAGVQSAVAQPYDPEQPYLQSATPAGQLPPQSDPPSPSEEPRQLPPADLHNVEPRGSAIATAEPPRQRLIEPTPFPAAPPPRPVPQREPTRRSRYRFPNVHIGFEPLEMIFEARFTPSIEVALWKMFSLEVTPMFLINDSPTLWDLYGTHARDEGVFRSSDGIGPLLGASVSLGVWLQGKPFRGTFLRPFITNYAAKYTSKVDGGIEDTQSFVERRLGLLVGTMKRLGPLSLSAAIGLSYELNGTQGCELEDEGPRHTPTSNDCGGRLLIATDESGRTSDLFGPLHPFQIEGRVLVGVVFD